LDFKETIAYTGTRVDRYFMFYYYGTLSLVGNEILPTNTSELLFATLLVFAGAIVVGLTIGEFSAIMSAITARDREKSEELDIISTSMISLRIPEDIQARVLEYYDELVKADFIKEAGFYSLLSPGLSNAVKLFSLGKLEKISFLDTKSRREVESFANKCTLSY
jgi:hypothetical protein